MTTPKAKVKTVTANPTINLCKTGFSKDEKHQCPRIFRGLFVSLNGNSIRYLDDDSISDCHYEESVYNRHNRVREITVSLLSLHRRE